MPHLDLLNPEYMAWKQFLKDSENWSPQEILDYQTLRLKEVISEAYEHAPGYKKLFDDHGVSPDSFKTIDDLKNFPIINKELFRDHLNDFSQDVPDLIKNRTYITTAGSTGIPLGLYRNPDAFSKELASKAHQYNRVGWDEETRQITLRGIPINNSKHIEFMPEFNEVRFSSYHMTPEYMEEFFKIACDYRPEWVRCYPSSGCLFAQWLKDNGKEFPRIKGVLCASENLYDFQRELLQGVFGGRVFSHYGHYELAALAGFCELEDTYHVLPQYGFVELLAPDGSPVTNPGEMGEIVATSFLMRATPIIRYRTLDYAVLEGFGCPSCGRPYQIWSSIEGRAQEFIITSDDRKISMTAINFHDSIFDHVKQFQFYQDKKGSVIFKYIPKDSFIWEDLRLIGHKLKTKIGQDFQIVFKKVKEIPLTKRGKHRILIQKIKDQK